MSTETSTQIPAAVQIPANTRIGDADRDIAVEQLAAHYAEGRLTHAEFDERSAAALTALTQAELAALLADLPTAVARTHQLVGAAGPSASTAEGQGALEVWRDEVLHNWMVFCLVAVVTMAMTGQPWMLAPVAAWGLRVADSRRRARRDPQGYLASRGSCRRSRRTARRRALA